MNGYTTKSIRQRMNEQQNQLDELGLEIDSMTHRAQMERLTGHLPPKKDTQLTGPGGERISASDKRGQRVEYTRDEILSILNPAPGVDTEKLAEALPPIITIGRKA